ncbi:hypothetical protein [Brevibacterium oceani]|uniref:hypothetical protein n=1 Tax=Brevibacterium oceani TaxID=358099 RepID=UPI001B340D82|nr:hypothetical protein [Brevibacterium oceani]
MRGHVRSVFRIKSAQRDADGDRRPRGIDEFLQPLEVIRGDGALFVMSRFLPFRRPERPPVEGIAAEPQRRRTERLQLLVDVGLRRIESGVDTVGGEPLLVSSLEALIRAAEPIVDLEMTCSTTMGVGLGALVMSEPVVSPVRHPLSKRTAMAPIVVQDLNVRTRRLLKHVVATHHTVFDIRVRRHHDHHC